MTAAPTSSRERMVTLILVDLLLCPVQPGAGRIIDDSTKAWRPEGRDAGPGRSRSRAGTLRHPVEDDAKEYEGRAGGEAHPEQATLREAGNDVVAEGLPADQAADDDHRQHD